MGEFQDIVMMNCSLSNIHLIETGSHPGGIDFVFPDTGIFQTFGKRLNQQNLCPSLPAFAKSGTSHTNDDNFIFDSLGHFISPPLQGQLSSNSR